MTILSLCEAMFFPCVHTAALDLSKKEQKQVHLTRYMVLQTALKPVSLPMPITESTLTIGENRSQNPARTSWRMAQTVLRTWRPIRLP